MATKGRKAAGSGSGSDQYYYVNRSRSGKQGQDREEERGKETSPIESKEVIPADKTRTHYGKESSIRKRIWI